jgi:hypothetical protein
VFGVLLVDMTDLNNCQTASATICQASGVQYMEFPFAVDAGID